MCKGDLLLSAVDFHCSPLVAHVLAPGTQVEHDVRRAIGFVLGRAALQDELENTLRELIWECRSSCTTKNLLSRHRLYGGPTAADDPDADPERKVRMHQAYARLRDHIDRASRSILIPRLQANR